MLSEGEYGIGNYVSMNYHSVAVVLTTMVGTGRMLALEAGAAILMRLDGTIR